MPVGVEVCWAEHLVLGLGVARPELAFGVRLQTGQSDKRRSAAAQPSLEWLLGLLAAAMTAAP